MLLIDWLIDWWLTDWLIDWLIDLNNNLTFYYYVTESNGIFTYSFTIRGNLILLVRDISRLQGTWASQQACNLCLPLGQPHSRNDLLQRCRSSEYREHVGDLHHVPTVTGWNIWPTTHITHGDHCANVPLGHFLVEGIDARLVTLRMFILSILVTSHAPIGSYRPVGQSGTAYWARKDSRRHVSTAALRSSPFFGEKGKHSGTSFMDPGELSNM